MEMSILIVEDEKSIRDVLKSYFLREGWNVYTSDNGLDALKNSKKIQFKCYFIGFDDSTTIRRRSMSGNSANIYSPNHDYFIKIKGSGYGQRSRYRGR